MIEYQLGVVGAGNMAEAILRGILNENGLNHNEIVAYDPVVKRQQILAMEFSIMCARDNSVPGACPRVLLAVKPQVMAEALSQIAPVVREDATIITIAAGITTEYIDQRLGGRGRIVRVMPNTPMFVGWGVSAIAPGPRAGSEDIRWTQKSFAARGRTGGGEERILAAGTAGTGSRGVW